MQSKPTRWPYVAAGFVMLISLSTLYAWSIFRAPFTALYPSWTATDLSLNFTICMTTYCVGGFLGGKLSAKASKRVSVLVSAGLMLLSFNLLSLLPAGDPAAAKLMLYLFYGCLCGLGTGVGYNAIIGTVMSWFPDKGGRVSGFLLMGFGMGSMLMAQIANTLVGSFGLLPAFRILGFGVAAVLFLGSFFMVMPPSGVVLPPAPSVDAPGGGRELTSSQMLRTASFWVYFAWNLCFSASGLLVYNSAAGIAVWYGAAAILGLVVSLSNGLGRLVIGTLMDRFGGRFCMFLCDIAVLAAGGILVAGALSKNAVLVFLGMLVIGACFGMGITISANVVRTLYGSRYYDVNFSLTIFCSVPASFLGPLVSGALQDRSGGDYTSTFVMVVVFGVVATLANFLLDAVVKRESSVPGK